MLATTRQLAFLCYCFQILLIGALLLLAPRAQAQKPLIYLSISNPTDSVLPNSAEDFEPILAPFRQKMEFSGYRVITQPDTLRQLLAQPDAPPYLYADIVCYQRPGGYPTIVFGVRDTLNVPWFTISESTRVFLSQLKGFSNAANYLAGKLPATFVARFGPSTPSIDRAPQFMAYDNIGFPAYLEQALLSKSIRQQLSQGTALELEIHIDDLGIATLQTVRGSLILDEHSLQLLQAAVRATPPWGPAYQNGRRKDVTTYFGRKN